MAASIAGSIRYYLPTTCSTKYTGDGTNNLVNEFGDLANNFDWVTIDLSKNWCRLG